MKFTPQQYAQALYDSISETRPKDHNRVLDNFVKVLAEYGDVGEYDKIEEAYKEISEKGHGIKSVQITTARETDAKAIVRELNEIVGKNPDVRTKIDENIIGGVMVKVDDSLIDASVKNSLNQLKKQMTNT